MFELAYQVGPKYAVKKEVGGGAVTRKFMFDTERTKKKGGEKGKKIVVPVGTW